MSEIEAGPPVSVTRQGAFTPTVTVGTTISGVRRVVCTTQTGGISNELTLLTSTSGPKGEMDKLNEIDGRLRQVEVDLASVKERLSHMPSTVAMWAAIVGVVLPVGAGVVAILWWVIDSSIAPLLARTAG